MLYKDLRTEIFTYVGVDSQDDCRAQEDEEVEECLEQALEAAFDESHGIGGGVMCWWMRCRDEEGVLRDLVTNLTTSASGRSNLMASI